MLFKKYLQNIKDEYADIVKPDADMSFLYQTTPPDWLMKFK